MTRDVAVLQIKGVSHLHTVALGNSSTVKVGQKVTAVGNAGAAAASPLRPPAR